MSLDPAELRAAVARHGRVARVVVAEAQGSVPREVGAAMLVFAAGQSGTIGGGALEYAAAARARDVLAGRAASGLARQPLGPALGQCCGGAVTLLTEVIDADALEALAGGDGLWARPVTPESTGRPEPLSIARIRGQARRGTQTPEAGLVEGWMVEPLRQPRHTLWLHGAGHVGRAIVAVLAPLPDWAITWVDTGRDRFPDDVPPGVDLLAAADPARAVAHAPRAAHHLILTYSHALDLALCDAVLRRGFAGAGLIGSATKWARFRKRLAASGHAEAEIARITCPIGDPALGKHPQAIAVGVVAGLIRHAAASERFAEGAGGRRA